MHKLQKKKLFEEATTKEVTDVINALKEWQASYHSEAVRAIRGIGKYRLAPAYQQFSVDPVHWMQWSVTRQEQHVTAFLNYIPTPSETFTRPKNAGSKAEAPSKRRRDQNEPELFFDSLDVLTPAVISSTSMSQSSKPPVPKKVTPIKIQKIGPGNYSTYKSCRCK